MAKGRPGVARSAHLYEPGQILNGLEILEQLRITKQEAKRTNTYKAYKYKCVVCGYTDIKVETVFKMGSGCACCKRKIVVEHINSIVADETTHWMVDYFPGGWNEAKLYMRGSEKKVKLKCPDCGKIKDKPLRIADLYKNRGIACECQDGISYAEKVGRVVFKQIDTDCIYQYKPDWSQGKIYDFYLPSYNTIIELHGQQHYNPVGFMGEKQAENDAFKEKIARENGVSNYFQVDCSQSTHNWIKDNIEKIDIFNWSSIDWLSICEQAEKNLVKKVCTYKQNNPNTSTKELCKMFSISAYAVHTYLKKGYELGWCNYLPKDTPRKIEKTTGKAIAVYKDGKLEKEYRSIKQCCKNSKIDFGVKFAYEGIKKVGSVDNAEYKGYVFKFINNYRERLSE